MFWSQLPLVVIFLLLVLSTECVEQQHQVCMLIPASTKECFNQYQGMPISDVAAKISCLQDLIWKLQGDTGYKIKQKYIDFLKNLTASLTKPKVPGLDMSKPTFFPTDSRVPYRNRYLFPPTGHRIRKEYRTLTKAERDRFHNALKKLYKEGFVAVFAKLHGLYSAINTGGASFLPWNRIMLLVFEEALRYHEPKTFLPYWDSTIDDALDNPAYSVIWSPAYFGNGDGNVVTGPAAYWITDQGRLQREIGHTSHLFKKKDIQRLLQSKCKLQDISKPNASILFDLQRLAAGPHSWIGGDMGSFVKAGFDPVFYMHRAYVDYIWEQFRYNQRVFCGIDPSQDYPNVTEGDPNHPDVAMTGFDWFINRDGIKAHWTDTWYKYGRTATCPDCCPMCPNSTPIYCDDKRNVCVAASRSTSGKHNREHTGNVQTSAPRNRGRLFEGPST